MSTPFFFADTVEEVKAHLDKGFNINQIGYDYHTPLTRACLDGNLNRVKLLVEHGADPTIQSSVVNRPHAASSPIAIATFRGHFHVVKYLTSVGVPLGGSMIAAINSGFKNIVDFFLDSNMIIDLEEEVDYYSNTSSRLTFLMAACEAKQFEIVAKLLACGANPNTVVNKSTALLRTVYCNTEQQRDVAFYIFHMLIAFGADIHSKENSSKLFQLAVRTSSAAIVGNLIDSGMDVNAPNCYGETPLIIAVKHSPFRQQTNGIIIRLIQAGANPYLKDGDAHDAFWYAENSGGFNRPEIKEMLLSYELMHRL
jgi:ankyrin repeat protein